MDPCLRWACGACWGNTDTNRMLLVTITCLENLNADPCETGVVPVQLPVTCSGLKSGPMTWSHKVTTTMMMMVVVTVGTAVVVEVMRLRCWRWWC